MEQGAGLSINQENTVSNLRQQANDLMRTRDELQDKVPPSRSDSGLQSR